MIDRPHLHMRCADSAGKRRWMRSLAMLLQVMEDSAILKTDRRSRTQAGVRVRAPDVAAGRIAWGAAKGATVTGGQLTSTAAPKALAGDPAGARLQTRLVLVGFPLAHPLKASAPFAADPPAETRKMAK